MFVQLRNVERHVLVIVKLSALRVLRMFRRVFVTPSVVLGAVIETT